MWPDLTAKAEEGSIDVIGSYVGMGMNQKKALYVSFYNYHTSFFFADGVHFTIGPFLS